MTNLRPKNNIKPRALAIGSSTGGPQALTSLFEKLSDKQFSVPIFITQHMPPNFTTALVEHIGKASKKRCFEGANGMKIESGAIYVAPGDYHMGFEKKGTDIIIKLSQDAPENFCRPAVDYMARSLLDIYGSSLMMLVLTGMGQDGLSSAKLLAEKNALIAVQDQASSVIWGMPGAIANAGLANYILPLNEIPEFLKKNF